MPLASTHLPVSPVANAGTAPSTTVESVKNATTPLLVDASTFIIRLKEVSRVVLDY